MMETQKKCHYLYFRLLAKKDNIKGGFNLTFSSGSVLFIGKLNLICCECENLETEAISMFSSGS